MNELQNYHPDMVPHKNVLTFPSTAELLRRYYTALLRRKPDGSPPAEDIDVKTPKRPPAPSSLSVALEEPHTD